MIIYSAHVIIYSAHVIIYSAHMIIYIAHVIISELVIHNGEILILSSIVKMHNDYTVKSVWFIVNSIWPYELWFDFGQLWKCCSLNQVHVLLKTHHETL